MISKSGVDKSAPVTVGVTFHMPIPKSKRKKVAIGDPHTIRPDLDNLLKLTTDASNGLLFVDDSQIHSISASKVYGDVPMTVLTIEYGVV